MGVSGIGSGSSSLRADYDFRKMTNAQFLAAVQQLGSQGKISHQDETFLSFMAQGTDSVPINGPRPSVAQTLSDPAQHDFLTELENIDYSSHHTPGSVGTALVDSMLNDLRTYQGAAIERASGAVSENV
jgi:hypothetical protein